MRILQICSARQFGGGERHLADLANTLSKRGQDVFVAVAPDSPLISQLNIPRDRIYEIRMRNSWDIPSAYRIAELARDNGIDIIHAHVGRDYPLAAFAARRAGVPYVLTRHVLFPLKAVHRRTLRSAARVIAVSAAVAGALRKQNIFESERIVTVHNGVDIDLHDRSKAGTDRSTFTVGTVGHLSVIKGQEDLVRAAAIVGKVRDNVRFTIVGEDKSKDGENRLVLERLIKELDLVGKVELAGWSDNVLSLLSTFDVTVSTSRSEAFGLAIVEAMAAGSPVIATATEGASEIIDNGKTGVIVPVKDPNALAEAIVGLLDHPEIREGLASAALTSVRRRFSLERMVDATESIYAEVLAETASPK